MIKNCDIICISSIDWDFIWQGHQEIMSTFAKNNNKVLFIENTGIRMPTLKDMPRLKKRLINWFRSIRGFRKEQENLYVYSPIILPFPYSRIARWINRYIFIKPIRRWMGAMEFRAPIVWTFLPTGFALDLADSVDRKLLIYYCIADFYELADNPKKVAKTESELIRKSDLIFAQGDMIKENCRRLNDNIHIFPFGVNIEAFERFRLSRSEAPSDISSIKKPIIGYVGGIHRHIDFELVKFIAKSHPEWSIVLIGPTQTDTFKIHNLANVFCLGKKDFPSLPSYIDQFDVGIIPYNKTGYTATVYPTKLNEYHALGKPVVSTDLPEITLFNRDNNNLVSVARTYQEFCDCILESLDGSSGSLINQRIASARKNSWTVRIKEMSDLIEETIERKSRQPSNWQENFVRLYRTSRKKFLKAAIICLGLYGLLFHTPLMWLAADPLKILQAPEGGDCIVVFAGGVGESGKAGQGYEERVQYAVKLYKKGYANKLIFSSGYMYIYEEPLLMKALAVALGIPEDAIILEDKAATTYRSVQLVNEILKKKGWNKIILISSPYHMRRVSLVFDKIAPDVKVTYSPSQISRFYNYSSDPKESSKWRGITIKQIKGILHEYLGILYYWWKGYI